MAFRGIRFIPLDPQFDFVRRRYQAFALTGLLFVATVVALATQGLNLGIDFAGGTVIEVAAAEPIDVGRVREQVGALGVGQTDIQNFGGPNDVLIRIQAQETEAATQAAVQKVRAALGPGYEYRRVENVGPKVGSELLRDGLIATALAILGIGIYVYFRFEWQFAVSALVSTFHDVFVTLGLFSILRLEFDLTAIAALLTLAGYSINDTVVVFDRIRETMRRRKSMPLAEIINLSVNRTLSRTIMTSLTTFLAIIPLLLFGGSSLFNFSFAMAWGIVIGTYSSIFVAAAMLLYMPAIGQLGPREDRAAETAPMQR